MAFIIRQKPFKTFWPITVRRLVFQVMCCKECWPKHTWLGGAALRNWQRSLASRGDAIV